MHTIEVDFDVLKALMLRRATEQVSYNDVLRDVLKLGPGAAVRPAAVDAGLKGAWTSKGVVFPAGTEFRARYKGEVHTGRVADGALIVNGERYDSPSSAAMSLTDSPVNGWTFWECRRPGDTSWQVIKGLRKG